jgi:NTP pyrophosphatase (non-canonical NTP hydrolase)
MEAAAQEKVREFTKAHNLTPTPAVALIDLLSELGEVAKDILKSSDYKANLSCGKPQSWDELGDVFYSLLTLAIALNYDLDRGLDVALTKYRNRILKTGTPGST